MLAGLLHTPFLPVGKPVRDSIYVRKQLVYKFRQVFKLRQSLRVFN